MIFTDFLLELSSKKKVNLVWGPFVVTLGEKAMTFVGPLERIFQRFLHSVNITYRGYRRTNYSKCKHSYIHFGLYISFS